MDLSIVIAIVGAVLSTITFVVGRLSAANKQGEQSGTLLSDIGYLKSNTDEIKSELKEQRTFNIDVSTKLIYCESEIKELKHRLDDHIKE